MLFLNFSTVKYFLESILALCRKVGEIDSQLRIAKGLGFNTHCIRSHEIQQYGLRGKSFLLDRARILEILDRGSILKQQTTKPRNSEERFSNADRKIQTSLSLVKLCKRIGFIKSFSECVILRFNPFPLTQMFPMQPFSTC